MCMSCHYGRTRLLGQASFVTGCQPYTVIQSEAVWLFEFMSEY